MQGNGHHSNQIIILVTLRMHLFSSNPPKLLFLLISCFTKVDVKESYEYLLNLSTLKHNLNINYGHFNCSFGMSLELVVSAFVDLFVGYITLFRVSRRTNSPLRLF
jgi:hypothetical protein